jgi:hypothetical protein
MNIITAPHDVYDLHTAHAPRLFLAGGITNCEDWQTRMIDLLACQSVCNDLTVYNPRRQDFDISNPKASEEQICWEFAKLRDADIVSFWFAPGSVNPIVFYELGMWGNSRGDRPMCVGCDPAFTRTQDVVIQTQLARPEVSVQTSLEAMVDQVVAVVFHWYKMRQVVTAVSDWHNARLPRITDTPAWCPFCHWHGTLATASDLPGPDGEILCPHCGQGVET